MSFAESVTAHHEAAHAVVNYRVSGFAGGGISIVPNEARGSLGHAEDFVSNSFDDAHMEARVLSCYAGGHAQRELDASLGDQGCDQDELIASELLEQRGWTAREPELRGRSLQLVRHHWAEIVAVAEELLVVKELDDAEVQLFADAAAGDPDVNLAQDLAQYRAFRDAGSSPDR